MSITINQWSPDTCTCTVEFEFDDALPASQRIHTLRSIPHRGPEHENVLTADVLYQRIRDENRWKNRTLAIVQELDASVHPLVRWEFNAARTLLISFAQNVPNSLKATLQERADAEFGAGNVIIQ